MVCHTRLCVLLLHCVLVSRLVATLLRVVLLLVTGPSHILGESASHRSCPMLTHGHLALLMRVDLTGEHSCLTGRHSCTLSESLALNLFLTEHTACASDIVTAHGSDFGRSSAHSTLRPHVASLLSAE